MTAEENAGLPEEFAGRNLGRLAEETFRTWISAETAITYNSSENDKEGWDFFLEFPFLEPERGRPWDTASPRIQCLIQVKGKDLNSLTQKQRNVKLDNWQKLIYAPLPAFFVIYEFDGSVLQTAYLVHVDKQWMEKGLQRLRQARHGESTPLHKQSMTLTWSDDDKIEPTTGRGLASAILQHIGHDFDTYVEEKQKSRLGAGSPIPFLMHVRGGEYSSVDEMYTDLVDFALGIKESEFSVTIEKDVRFGEPSEVIEEHQAFLKALPGGAPAILTFRASAGRQAATFPAKVHSPHYFFPGVEIPSRHKKYRIEYQLGELFFYPGTNSVEVEFRMDLSPEPVYLRDLVNSWRVISLLHAATTNPVSLEIGIVEGPVGRIASIQKSEIPDYFALMAQAVENAWFLVRYLDLRADEVQVSLEEIRRQATELRDIRTLLNRSHPPFRSVTASLDLASSEPEKEHAMIFGRAVTLGAYRLLVAVGMGGPYKPSQDGLEFEISPLMPVNTKVYFLSDTCTAHESVASLAHELTKEGYVVLGPEVALAQWLEEEQSALTVNKKLSSE